MQFDLDDLRLITYVAEAGSLSAAAKRMHRSLAAVSSRVHNLESRAGMQFFSRGARGVTLTPPGEAMLHHARTMLSQAERLRGDLQQYTRGLRAHVRIFANTTAVSDFLPEVLSRFLALHPDTDIDLQERLNADIRVAVREGTTDLGIVAGLDDHQGVRSIHFSTDRLVLVVPKGHAFAKSKRLAFKDTLDEHHIGMHEGSTLHSFLSRVTEGSARPYRQRIRLHGFDAICRMVEAGVGIGVLPESAAMRHRHTMGIALVPLVDDWAVRERYILTRDGVELSAAAQALVDAILLDHRDKAAGATGTTRPSAARHKGSGPGIADPSRNPKARS